MPQVGPLGPGHLPQPTQGRSTSQCYSPSALQWPGLYLAVQLTGSAFISQPVKNRRLKTGIKIDIQAPTNASYLGILLFFSLGISTLFLSAKLLYVKNMIQLECVKKDETVAKEKNMIYLFCFSTNF